MNPGAHLPDDYRSAEEWFPLIVLGGILQIDASLATNFRVVLDRDAELRLDMGTSGARVRLRVEQDVVGSRALTPNAAIVFRNGETGFNIRSGAGLTTILDFQWCERLDGSPGAWEVVTPLDRTRADALYEPAGDYQPLDALLTSIAGLTTAANKGLYFTGSDVAATFDLTAAGRAILDDADAAAQRTTLELGTANSPQFTGIELGHASDTTLTRSSAGNMAIEGNVVYRAGGTDVPVADGGTGASTEVAARGNLGLGTADSPDFTALKISGTKVVGAQGGTVDDPTGGATVDAECRAALITLLGKLRTHGLIAT